MDSKGLAELLAESTCSIDVSNGFLRFKGRGFALMVCLPLIGQEMDIMTPQFPPRVTGPESHFHSLSHFPLESPACAAFGA